MEIHDDGINSGSWDETSEIDSSENKNHQSVQRSQMEISQTLERNVMVYVKQTNTHGIT